MQNEDRSYPKAEGKIWTNGESVHCLPYVSVNYRVWRLGTKTKCEISHW